jgi:hypothetical protein
VIGFMEIGKVYRKGNSVSDKKGGRWMWYDEDVSVDKIKASSLNESVYGTITDDVGGKSIGFLL